jgi:hypothetical protein
MPIKGVSEVVRLHRLGKIRLGIKIQTDDGTEYPSPTDYFVCPDEVKKVFGEKPKELRIMFPTEDEKQWASQYYRCYSETGDLLCRGDGELAVARVETIGRERSSRYKPITKLLEMPCDPDRCPCYQKGYCHRVLNLQFLLPDCPDLGVYQLDTTSFYSIVNVNSGIKLIRGTCGRVSMIPLSLKLIEQEVKPEGIEKTVQVLSLTGRYSLAETQKYAQTPPGQVMLLPVPDNEPPDDLFPPVIRRSVEPAKPAPSPSEALLDLWTRVKSKVWRLDVRDEQVANWFRRNYRIADVRLSDFDLVEPPSQVTIEALVHFLTSLQHHEDSI